jgi:hypothetical protein
MRQLKKKRSMPTTTARPTPIPNRQHQPVGMARQQQMQPGRTQRIDAAARRAQGADRRLGEGGDAAQQEGEAQHHRRRGAVGQVEADVLGKRHQPVLDAVHEQHQAEHHRQHAEGNQLALAHVRAQRGDLEQCQEQRQRHHGAHLVEEAHTDIRRQQAMQVDQAQPARPGAPAGILVHVLVADAALLDAHGAEEFAVAQAALLDWFGHRRGKTAAGGSIRMRILPMSRWRMRHPAMIVRCTRNCSPSWSCSRPR